MDKCDNQIVYRNLTGSAVGVILKDLVRRAMVEIARQRFTFVATAKVGYDGMSDDVFTTADTAAQDIYAKLIQECFPGFGIIGEEKLNVPCTLPDANLYFTIDPLDGTRAYKRLQTYGVGTMIALVDGTTSEILSAWIGDPFAGEMFGYRPGADKAWRINKLETFTLLPDAFDVASVSLTTCALLRSIHQQTPISRHLIATTGHHIVESGSIGIMFSRLWTGECTHLCLPPSNETPWDSTPVIGISKKLGYSFYRPNPPGDAWVPAEMLVPTKVCARDHEILVAHSVFDSQIRSMEIRD